MGKNPLLYLFEKLWTHAHAERHTVIAFWAMFILATGIHLLGPPFIWAYMINTIQQEGITKESFATLLILLTITVVYEFLFWMLHGPARYLEEKTAFKVRAEYRRFLLSGIMNLPLDWHTEHHSGDTIDKVGRGASGLNRFGEETYQIIYGIVQLVGSYVVLTYYSMPAGIIVAAMALLTGWIIVRFDKILVVQYGKLNLTENAISESIFDSISNISTVIILRAEKVVFDSIMRKIEEPFELFKKNAVVNECKWFATSMCCAVMAVAVLGVFFWQNLGSEKGVLVGSVYILIQYLTRVSEQFYRFTTIYGDILVRKTQVANAEELAEDFTPASFSNHVLPRNWKRLDIKHLTFSYGGEDTAVPRLANIALAISRSEKIALVGATGSGKTTLLKVMRDLYHPTSLELFVDGVLVPEGFGGISRAIALAPQDPELFATSIWGNITLGAEYSRRTVDECVRMSCFDDVLKKLPRGYYSTIKERGVNLSGGERQRLALARAILASRDKEIVLFDEPTSALDALTEIKVYQHILSGFSEKTVISSVHRLHLLPLFDRVCVFDEGKLVASGAHCELLKTCVVFASMWEAQHKV